MKNNSKESFLEMVFSEFYQKNQGSYHLVSICKAFLWQTRRRKQQCKSQHHHQHSNVSPGTSPDNTAQERLFCKLYSKKYSYMCIKCKGQKNWEKKLNKFKKNNTYQYIYIKERYWWHVRKMWRLQEGLRRIWSLTAAALSPEEWVKTLKDTRIKKKQVKVKKINTL